MSHFRIILTVLFCAWGLGAAAPKPAEDLLQTTSVHTIHLHVTGEGWKMMQPTRTSRLEMWLGLGNRPSTRPAVEEEEVPAEGERLPPSPFGFEYAYVRGTFECDGETLSNVGVRFKGNSSYSFAQSTLKRPFKIDFDRFVDGQKFHGLTTINLGNNAMDVSQIREALSYAVFRDCGVPASRTAFAQVYLTVDGQFKREYLGLYTIIEEVDETFLAHQFGKGDGLLCKPEGVRGISYLGDRWEQYTERYRPKGKPSAEAGRRVIELARLVNSADDQTFREKIESVVNVDAFLRFMAANAVLANLDSFLGTGHNYYLYLNPEDNRFYFIPWDLNLSLGGLGMFAPPNDQVALSISRPHLPPNKLIDRLLSIDEYELALRRHVREIAERTFAPDRLRPLLEKMQEIVRESEAISTATTRPAIPQRRAQILEPRAFVTARWESIQDQLAGKTEGIAPEPRRATATTRPASPGSMAVAFLRHADANLDRSLSLDEATTAAKTFFEQADANRSGTLRERTIAAALERIMPRPAAPANRPSLRGLLRREPPPRPGADPFPPQRLAQLIVSIADGDADGSVDLDEMLEASTRAFRAADTDQSGLVNEAELIAAFSRIVQFERQAGGAPPGRGAGRR